MSRLPNWILIALGTCWLFASATGAAGEALSVRGETSRMGGTTVVQLEVDGRLVEVHRTEAEISSLRTGANPEGTAAFASWNEAGQRWSTFSRDGGSSWASARPIRDTLELRDGSVQRGGSMPAPVAGLESTPESTLHVVQFRTLSLPEWRSSLMSLGAKILAAFPHHGHIARLAPKDIETIRALPFVERVEPYHPSYRIEPELRLDLTSGTRPVDEQRIRLIVFEWGPVAKERVLAAAQDLGARAADYGPSGHVLDLWADGAVVTALAGHPDVMWIERWTPSESDMDLNREEAGSNWVFDNFGYCGAGVRGEVFDAGIQADHPDFDGILLHGPSNVDSHGTATYGIVFGNGDIDGDGEGQALGHMPCGEGIFADNGEVTDRFAHTQELKQAPYFASFQTNSWGGGLTTNYTSRSQELDDIIWRLDIAILNSQSNNGNQSSRPEAWAKNMISVGGIRHYDTLDTSDDAWAFGASIGPAADGRIKPDVSYWYDFIYTTAPNDGYTPGFGGTSAATPESAGVLGLIVEMWADNVWGTHPTGVTPFDKQPHFSTLKALLINSAQQYPFSGAGVDLGRFHQGWGRPNARAAYERAAASFIVDETDLLEVSDTTTYFIDVAPGETELKATLVYPDPPGTTSASIHRINDLDLRVTSPSATIYHGNSGLETGTESTAGGAADSLNTVENVFLTNPTAGTWTIEIEAAEVNQDAHLPTAQSDVAYALVVTGGREIYTSGAATLDRRPDDVACTDSIELTVRDGNVGVSVNVQVSSGTETTPESVTLNQTASGSGIYTGQVAVVATAAAADGDISVSDGEIVTLEYIDADDGAGGTNVAIQVTASVDCAPPQISGVWVSDLTDTEATISWVTDEPSNTSVSWGNSVPPSQSDSRAVHVTVHNLRLTGLNECTSYFFSVQSEDPVGNSSADDNGGAYYLLTTLTDSGGQLHDCREGTLILEADVVGCNATVPIRLTDTDLNLDPGLVETVQVELSSATETTAEPVLLTEDGPNTGVFIGFLPTGSGAPVTDGVLQAAHGDWITGTYFDANDGGGVGRLSIYSIDADCEGPIIAPITVTSITDAAAAVQWTVSEPATGFVEWGTTPALGSMSASSGSGTGHSAGINPFLECERVYFRITTTDPYGNTSIADRSGAPFEFNGLGVPGTFHVDTFETDAGWTLEGEWEIDAPQGLGTAPGDPGSAFSGSRVLGHDLSGLGAEPGDYEPTTNEAAISPVIDGSSFVNTQIKFKRHLNVTNGSFAYIDVRDSGGSWNLVYQTTVAGIQDSSWFDMAFDISTYADNNPNLQIRFRERSFIVASFAAGWNIDDLTFRDGSQPPLAACGSCGGAPTFAGLSSATDDDPCGDTGVQLQWSTAPGWGTGTAGTYAIYRDTGPGFTPGPGNLIASGLAVTQWTDVSAPNDTDLYYAVRAENDETCASGPANGGLTDDNLAILLVRDDTSQPAPPDVGSTLVLDAINGAHARLDWMPPGGAAAYRVYRSGQPDMNFGQLSETATPEFDDVDVLVDGQIWYYRIVAVDACGNEGP